MKNKDKVKDLTLKIVELFDKIDYGTAANAITMAIGIIACSYGMDENKEDAEEYFNTIIENLKITKTKTIKLLTDNGH